MQSETAGASSLLLVFVAGHVAVLQAADGLWKRVLKDE
jgi:hypothetical protein